MQYWVSLAALLSLATLRRLWQRCAAKLKLSGSMNLKRKILLLVVGVAIVAGLWQAYRLWLQSKPALPVTTAVLSKDVLLSGFRLGNLTLGKRGDVYGTRGRDLFRVVDNGRRAEQLFTFKHRISAIHERADGLLIVSTDDGRWEPEEPCLIYRSKNGGRSFEKIKTIEGGTVLWWSLDSDKNGRLYLAEYGPQQQGMSKTLWRSDNDGDDWKIIYQAPDKDKVHLHRIAVDPYTDALWLTVGDGKNRNMLRSEDHGESWQQIDRLQSTSVVFAEDAIYWGRDKKGKPGVLRYDRATQRFTEYFNPREYGNYGGSIYDLARLPSGELIVPFMKYADQPHISSVWRVAEDGAELLLQLASEEGKGVAIETIAGPDNDGWVYWTGYQLKME